MPVSALLETQASMTEGKQVPGGSVSTGVELVVTRSQPVQASASSGGISRGGTGNGDVRGHRQAQEYVISGGHSPRDQVGVTDAIDTWWSQPPTLMDLKGGQSYVPTQQGATSNAVGNISGADLCRNLNEEVVAFHVPSAMRGRDTSWNNFGGFV